MEFVDKKLSEITPYKNNPRNNDEAVGPVAESIKEFGFKVPIVIDKNGEIVNGHTRYKAAKKLGLETVPVIVADDLSDEQIKAFRLADNKVGEIAVWDLDLLNEELNDILDLDMSAFGFDVLDNLDDLIEDEKDLDDFTENVPDEPKSKLGDIYQLGSHKLMCGDSTNGADVKKLMNGELADLLLTDPPYNVAYEGKTKDSLTIKNDSMDNDSFRQFLVNAFSSANEVMKPGAVFYIWHADSEGYNFRGACFDIGWTVRQCLIWNKNSMVLGRQDYHWKHEPCLYGWKDGAGHLWASDRKQTTVIDYEKPQRNGVHPTMKPVGLFDYQIKNNTKGSDIVLDLFGGSGTTLIACESNGRHARLMEYDPKYVDVIIKRWEELTGESVIQLN
ncbi:TPA: DNA modification methylase [Streptococcus pyogenes]|uniref:DNA modification methylase n=1 Tax=Streptococcus pyogenes TaxID=1314 RepID=UPI00109C5D9C|nr:DNA modification methylase [Streptococcus pyogenes]QQA64837.1 ParB N-terminal domain-containing protein [Streptococcus pyogenes]VHE85347.1 phage associated protein [Streptococcus pyogenes]VHF13160.1 phage associated protein [Streptococcus pyogenes]VHM44345.1 phage associated protein [Streptococcus pyogenes]HEP1521701.1 ParB N-terminal domain-containing protein [Streptococcus pyogenes]